MCGFSCCMRVKNSSLSITPFPSRSNSLNAFLASSNCDRVSPLKVASVPFSEAVLVSFPLDRKKETCSIHAPLRVLEHVQHQLDSRGHVLPGEGVSGERR